MVAEAKIAAIPRRRLRCGVRADDGDDDFGSESEVVAGATGGDEEAGEGLGRGRAAVRLSRAGLWGTWVGASDSGDTELLYTKRDLVAQR